METILFVLLGIQLFASTAFAKFEIETPLMRKLIKWLVIDGATIGLFYIVGYYSILLPIVMIGIGTTYHVIWCKKNGIHPLKATPKNKYYKLRGWKWEE